MRDGNNPDRVLNEVRNVLQNAGIVYDELEHEAVFDYETAAAVRERYKLTGTESKSLFLKSKDKQFYMLVTTEGKRVDTKRLKAVLGKKISIASGDDLQEVTGCLPGCAVPLGLPANVTTIVDNAIFEADRFIFSPGPPTRTIQLTSADLRKVFESVASRQPVLYIELD